MALTAKQQRFVEEYLLDLNATAAYRRAGYKAKTDEAARASAAQILTNLNVEAAIRKAMQERSERTLVSADEVVLELQKLAMVNMQDYITITPDGSAYMDLSRVTRSQLAAVQEITSETYMEKDGDDFKPVKKSRLKLTDKRASLELLGKHLGVFGKGEEQEGLDEYGKPRRWTIVNFRGQAELTDGAEGAELRSLPEPGAGDESAG